MDSEIRRRLLQGNPWFEDRAAFTAEIERRLPPVFVPRRLDLEAAREPGRAILIVGPRQVGKSTLVWAHLSRRDPHEILFINAEEPVIQRWARSPTEVVRDIDVEFPTVRTVFIEEAQRLEEAGLFVKGLVDARRELEILVTGSSSYDLEAKTRESLAGRAVRRKLMPLTLAELMAVDPTPIPAVQRKRAQDHLARQQVIGGYPGVWLHPSPARHLGDLVEAFVLRDASDRFAIRSPEAFRRLLVFAAGQVGQMVNYSEWAAHLGVAGTTVRDWIGLLEETWILKRVPPFAGGRRHEITGAGRLCFYDLGIRNAVLGHLEPDLEGRADRGALAEGWAFSVLSKLLPRGWTTHYWRSRGGAEVDFVLAGGDRVVALEVKAEQPGRITRSMRSFIEAYRPDLFLLAAGGATAVRSERIGETEIVRLPLSSLEDAVLERFQPVA